MHWSRSGSAGNSMLVQAIDHRASHGGKINLGVYLLTSPGIAVNSEEFVNDQGNNPSKVSRKGT